MRRWYEPRKDRPDLERSAIRKRGFVGYMDMLWREFFELLKLNLLFVLSCVPIITIPAALTAMHRHHVGMVARRKSLPVAGLLEGLPARFLEKPRRRRGHRGGDGAVRSEHGLLL